ncbi:MAG: amidohydrolase [Veillonellaceae bacterium]|uniref:amidohydrolase n=1 Tax=uncultured Selenomonas sp. TaxID=159275 RepID=UPI0025E37AC9|nr:amidohydrolase [uncultured Selenomonas sp.]MCI7540121.1 amidohydrolase [Veillonellaceae bacterium]
MNLLIKNATVVLPDGQTKTANIAVEGSKILAIGEAPADFIAEQTIDAKDMLAIPGFVNAHTHASMTLLRSYADDMELMTWLNDHIWPVEAKMISNDIYWGAALAAVEMIQSGTTTFADMYGPFMERVADVVTESGMRGVLSRGIIGVAPDGEKKLEENVTLYEDYNGAANGRIKVMFGPHAPYTCPPEFLKKVAAAAQRLGAEVHIHMNETKAEIEQITKQYGKRPFEYVEDTGLFESPTLAAHCVHLSDDEIAIIKKHNIRVAHNPGSNMKLASGIAPVPRLLKEGVTVALGTDGTSSNNNLDMLQEVQLAALLHKVNEYDPLAVPAFEALKMGTEYGAKAVGLDGIGRIAPGAKADIVLVSMKGAAWVPRFNEVSLLVYSGSAADVDTVICDGKVLMQHRELKTLDEEKIKYEAQKCAERLTK